MADRSLHRSPSRSSAAPFRRTLPAAGFQASAWGVPGHVPQVLSPWVPAPEFDFSLFAARLGLGRSDLFVDLGCGDGAVLLGICRAARCCGVGIELDPVLVRRARSALVAASLRNRVRVLHAPAGAHRLSGATVVFVHLLPWLARDVAAVLSHYASGMTARALVVLGSPVPYAAFGPFEPVAGVVRGRSDLHVARFSGGAGSCCAV